MDIIAFIMKKLKIVVINWAEIIIKMVKIIEKYLVLCKAFNIKAAFIAINITDFKTLQNALNFINLIECHINFFEIFRYLTCSSPNLLLFFFFHYFFIFLK